MSVAPLRLLAMFLLFGLFYAGVGGGAHLFGTHLSPGWDAVWSVIVAVVMVIALLWVYRWLVRWIEQRSATELAILPGMRLMAGGTAVGMLCIFVVYGFYWASGMLGVAHIDGGLAVFSSLTICIVASLAEELLMRGIMFRVMEQWLGSGTAIAFSSLMFGALHLFNPNATLFGAVAIAVESGLLFSAAYMLSRNLWLAIGVHFGWNLAESTILGATDSGLGLKGLFDIPVHGSDLITGGSFGPEASVPLLIVGTIAGLLFLYFAVRRGHWVSLQWRPRVPVTA